MAFKEVLDLNCDTTISLGGINKKTGKPNPSKIEGYYLGAKTVEDRKKKSGHSFIYAFQTPKGNVGVWGKTDLDRKMQSASTGAMTRVTQSGMQETPNGPMYKYKVEVDAENSIDVGPQPTAKQTAPTESYEASDEQVQDFVEETYEDLDEEAALDEIVTARPVAPKAPLATGAAQKARAEALLRSRKTA